MELRYGAYKSKQKEENLRVVDEFLSKVKIIPFANAIDVFYQEKLRLQTLGIPIEDYALHIGCAAKVANFIMVTDNE